MEKKEKLDVKKEVVNVNTTVKKVVAKPRVDSSISEEATSVQKTLDEHMERNQDNTKLSFDYKSFFTYLILILIVGGAVLLVFHFFDKYNDGKISKTTAPTTTRGLVTTSSTSANVQYKTTTATPTQATHTVFDKNRR